MLTDQLPITLPGVDGVQVFSDSASESRFYYVPTRPRVAMRDGAPLYSLAIYDPPPDTGTVAVLSLVIDLHLPQDQVDALKAALKKQTGGDVSVSPVPWTGGTFAVAVQGGPAVTGVPSLIGSNSAVVRVDLGMDGLTVLRALLKEGNDTALSIVFAMSYDAFRPAYEATVSLDSEKFRHWVQKECHANFVLVNFQDVKTYVTLKNAGALVITNTTFDPDSDPAFQRSVLASLQYLFEPLPVFGTLPVDGKQWSVGIGCSTMEDTQDIRAKVDFKMSEAKAVACKIYVQGSIEGLADAYDTVEPLILHTANPDPFTHDLRFTCYADFAADKISQVDVLLSNTANASLPVQHAFKQDTDSVWIENLTFDPKAPVDYRYTYKVTFEPGHQPPSLTSPEQTISKGQVFASVIARDLYSQREITVRTAQGFPWDLIDQVRVTLNPPKGYDSGGTSLLLTPEARTGSYAMVLVPADQSSLITYETKVISKQGKIVALPEMFANSAVLLDPFTPREVTFSATGIDWSDVTKVTVRAKADGKTTVGSQSKLSLTEAIPEAVFKFYYSDPAHKAVQYQASIVGKAGTETVRGTSQDQLITIQPGAADTAATS